MTSSDNSIWAVLLSCLAPACRAGRSMRVVRGLWEDGVSNVDFPGLGVTSSDNSIWVLFFDRAWRPHVRFAI